MKRNLMSWLLDYRLPFLMVSLRIRGYSSIVNSAILRLSPKVGLVMKSWSWQGEISHEPVRCPQCEAQVEEDPTTDGIEAVRSALFGLDR